MFGRLHDVGIEALTATVSRNRVPVEEVLRDLMSEKKAKRLTRGTGIEALSLAPPAICTSDLCYDSANRLLSVVDRGDIGALIFISQTADYLSPATSYYHTMFSPSMLILDARAFVMAFFWQQHSCPHLVDERYSFAAVIRQVAMCIRKTSPCGRLPAMQVQQPLSRHGRDMKSTFTLRVLARWRTISSLHEVEVVHHVLPMKRG